MLNPFIILLKMFTKVCLSNGEIEREVNWVMNKSKTTKWTTKSSHGFIIHGSHNAKVWKHVTIKYSQTYLHWTLPSAWFWELEAILFWDAIHKKILRGMLKKIVQCSRLGVSIKRRCICIAKSCVRL